MRVLLADDERWCADTVAADLRELAMAVDICYDGEAAMERLNGYDVAGLDRDLPEATGDAVRVAVMTLRRKLGDPPIGYTVPRVGHRFGE